VGLSIVAESKGPFEAYIGALRTSDIREKTEHTDRDAVKALVQKLAPPGVMVVHEAKGVKGKGTPDFKVRQNGQIVGYVETKPMGTGLAELKRLLKSEQISRYRTLSPNLILTDYLNWIWEHDGETESATLCDQGEVWSHKAVLNPDRIERLRQILNGFAAVAPQRIASANVLAHELATRSRLLRGFLREELERQQKYGQGGKLYGLYSAFKAQVSETITLSEFADAFSQTLCYGFFLAKLSANGTSLTLDNAKHFIPSSFKLIQELVGFLEALNAEEYDPARWVIDGVASVINGLDTWSIKSELSFKNRKGSYRKLKAKDEEEWRLFSRDPFIYFYEDYLSEYDREIKERRGVYYTPPPVVNFIVRSTDELLKNIFNLPLGLADDQRVTVLDFACGTGTFIVELIQQILENAGASSAKRELLIKDHVLKNVFAFEYLIAPYTIAHLKLSQYLEDRQIRLDKDDRFNIFLTNTLEPLEPQHNFFVPALSEETRNAAMVKHKRLLVITGNPPYSGHSLNMGSWISQEVRKYKKDVPELSKPGQAKWLQDDYVKFLRFAQFKMDEAPEGIVAVITNNAYLDNPTFRGMRRSLMDTFNQIYILDLHGSTKKKEQAPDGSHDENVFDIQQGVAIAFFVKKPGAQHGVWRSDLWGDRISKYRALSEAAYSTIDWQKLSPAAPFFLFRETDQAASAEYDKFWSIPEIFSPAGRPAPGIVTTHDEFAISFTQKEAVAKVKQLLETKNEDDAREIFTLCSQSQWSYVQAKSELAKTNFPKLLTPVLYRPFDKRWTIWDSNVAVHRRERIMRHMLRDNVAIAVSRQFGAIGEKEFDTVLATSNVVDFNCFRRGGEYIFPAYLYPNREGSFLEKAQSKSARIENISSEFRKWLTDRYNHSYGAEDVLNYVFAVLHAKTYREKYLDFLRSDFPRIPFPLHKKGFDALSALGQSLLNANLLRTVPRNGLGSYNGKGSNLVEKVRYADNEQAVYINNDQSFSPIPSAVWRYHIGGYNVLEKYLKDRRGRKLLLDDLNMIANVANVIAFTIEQMREIDTIYCAAL
jgi:predicted helicase